MEELGLYCEGLGLSSLPSRNFLEQNQTHQDIQRIVQHEFLETYMYIVEINDYNY